MRSICLLRHINCSWEWYSIHKLVLRLLCMWYSFCVHRLVFWGHILCACCILYFSDYKPLRFFFSPPKLWTLQWCGIFMDFYQQAINGFTHSCHIWPMKLANTSHWFNESVKVHPHTECSSAICGWNKMYSCGKRTSVRQRLSKGTKTKKGHARLCEEAIESQNKCLKLCFSKGNKCNKHSCLCSATLV